MNTINGLLDRSATLLLPIFFVATGLLIYLNLRLPLLIAGSLTASTLVFLFFKRNPSETTVSGLNEKMAAVGIWLFLFIAGLALTQSIYSKNLVYYLSISAAMGLLAASAMASNKSSLLERGIWWISAASTALLNWWSTQIVFPHGFGGIDHYYHLTLIKPIVESGSIPFNVYYGKFPLHHVFIGIVAEILAIPARSAYYVSLVLAMFSVGTLVIVFSRAIFLNLDWMPPAEWARLSFVVFIASDFIARYVYNGQHLTFAAIHIIGVLSLGVIIYWNERRSFRGRAHLIMLLFMVALATTHHFSAAILLFVSPAIFWSARQQARGGFTYLLFILIIVTQWSFVAVDYGLKLVVINVIPLLAGLSLSSPTAASATQPMWLIAYTTTGVALTLFFAQIGVLRGFKSAAEKETVQEKLLYVALPVALYALFGLMLVGRIAGLEGASPNRVLLFATMIFFPPLAVAGLYNLKLPRRTLSTGIVVCLVTFFAMSGITPAIETSLVGEDVNHNKKFESVGEDALADWYVDHQSPEKKTYSSPAFVEYETGTVQYRSDLEKSQISSEDLPVRQSGPGLAEYNMPLEDDEMLIWTAFDQTVGFKLDGWESRRFGGGSYAVIDRHSVTELMQSESVVYCNGEARVYAG